MRILIEASAKYYLSLKVKLRKLIINQMKDNKAPGEDQFVIEIVRAGGKVAAKKLTHLFSHILSSEEVPGNWKNALITQTFKEGDKREMGNYRLMILLSHLHRLFMVFKNRTIKTA